MAEAFPLHWPDGWPRTAERNRRNARNRWNKTEGKRQRPWTFAEARDALFTELERFGATDVVVSSNYKLTLNGLPSKNLGVPEDRGIAVYFALDGKPMVMAQDAYTRAEENLRALALVLKYLRGVEELGGGTMMEKAFAGFEALPSPEHVRQWWTILGVDRLASEVEIERAYREHAKARHPDAGGSHASMAELNGAREAGLRAARKTA